MAFTMDRSRMPPRGSAGVIGTNWLWLRPRMDPVPPAGNHPPGRLRRTQVRRTGTAWVMVGSSFAWLAGGFGAELSVRRCLLSVSA